MEPSYVDGWNIKFCSQFWKVWQYCKKLKLSYDWVILLLDVYPGDWKTCLYKNMHVNACSGIIHSSQVVEIFQMSISCWVDRHNVVYLYSGILFILIKEWNTDTCLNINCKIIVLRERSQSQKTTYWVTPIICKVLNKQNHRETK